jgi:hypothetical protein
MQVFSIIAPSSLEKHSCLPSVAVEYSQSQTVLYSGPTSLQKKEKKKTNKK